MTFPSFLLCIIHEDVLVNVKKALYFLSRLTLFVISGSLGQLIKQRGRLPEDLGLHYHLQVLTALEYLAKKKVVHLDIKGMIYRGKLCIYFIILCIYKQLHLYLNPTLAGLLTQTKKEN